MQSPSIGRRCRLHLSPAIAAAVREGDNRDERRLWISQKRDRYPAIGEREPWLRFEAQLSVGREDAMPLIVGVDEAGYGPNLGPLVIAASAWRVPGDHAVHRSDVASVMAAFLCCERSPLGNARGAAAGAAAGPGIADSKIVYRNGGVAALERAVLAALTVLRGKPGGAWAEAPPGVMDKAIAPKPGATAASPLPRTAAMLCRELADCHAAGWLEERANREIDLPLPRAAAPAEIDRAAALWRAAADETPLELVGLVARPVFPAEFNRLLEQRGRKSDLLSQASLELVFDLIDRLRNRWEPDEPLTIYCDKHGGRNRYSALLSAAAGGALFAPIEESRDLSRYRGRCGGLPFEWLFLSKAERLVPVALASMTAKYLRELAMEAFNRYWTSRVPGLRATAGYPVDARRFLAETEAARRAEAAPMSTFWRNK